MTSTRKHVNFFRILGAILLSLIINVGLLYLVDFLLRQQYGASAMRGPFYLVFALAAVPMFFLLLFPANRPFVRFKSFLRWLMLVLVGLAVWTGGSVWHMQNDIIYKPNAYLPGDAERIGTLSDVKQLTVPDVNGLKYNGYLWQNGEDSKNLVIYFGGNGEFVASAMTQLVNEAASKQVFQGYRVLMVDCPGYGLSEGQPGEQSNYRMALSAWDYAQAMQPKPEKIVVMAWSLGTGTAIRLAAEKGPDGLVLMAPFISGARLMDQYVGLKLFDGPLSFLVRNKYDNAQYAKETKANVLIIAASQDKLIPARQAEELAKHYTNKQALLIDGGHQDARFSAATQAAIANYLKTVQPPALIPVQGP